MKESIEKKEIVSIDLSSLDGLCQWRELYADNTASPWERTSISTADTNGIARLRKELKQKYGEDMINAV